MYSKIKPWICLYLISKEIERYEESSDIISVDNLFLCV